MINVGGIRRETPVQESFELRERRQMAMSVLDSPDLLMLIAESEGDVSSLALFIRSLFLVSC